MGRVLKVILYGSYTRGGWVNELHTAEGYQSDFDLLVIVNQKELTDRVTYWERAEERLTRERAITGTLRTPVNFIVHSLQEVNDGLAHGRYFFMDVARDGIALYQADDSELLTPKPKTPARTGAGDGGGIFRGVASARDKLTEDLFVLRIAGRVAGCRIQLPSGDGKALSLRPARDDLPRSGLRDRERVAWPQDAAF